MWAAVAHPVAQAGVIIHDSPQAGVSVPLYPPGPYSVAA
jgi:hypothetical protein